MSAEAISVSCAIGLHHHDEGAHTETCAGTRTTHNGTARCECRCHAPQKRAHR